MSLNNHKVLVTGASGYIGSALVMSLVEQGFDVTAVSRSGTEFSGANNQTIHSYIETKDLEALLVNIDTVYHLAARAHHTGESESAETMQEYVLANCDASVALYKLAQQAGIKNFVFLSSIGVNGNKTEERPFTENDVPLPIEQYAKSKWQAEQELLHISKSEDNKTNLTIVRPPLVYGHKAPGNFATLLKLAEKKLPLPIGAIKNAKTFIYIENLVDFLINYCCLPDAKGEVFVVADDTHFSTPSLYKELGKRFNAPVSIIYFPYFLLNFATTILRKKNILAKLNSSLEVDATKARNVLNWQAKISPEIALNQTVSRYKEMKKQ